MRRFDRVRRVLENSPVSASTNLTDNKRLTSTSFTEPSPFINLSPVDTGLNMPQFNALFESPPPFDHVNGHSVVGSSTGWSLHLRRPSISSQYLYIYISLVSIENSPPPSYPQSANTSNGQSTTSEWSAVGHATATGKSGRVIHSLQEDIARLTRECSVFRARAEETQRMNDVLKTQVQNMVDQIGNLELANETNLNSISRKDRKIEGLKSELQSEKNKRQRAEAETNKINQSMLETRDEFNQKTAQLNEYSNYYQVQYDVLVHSSRRERAETQRKLQLIRGDIITLKKASEEKSIQMDRLETIMSQKNREVETSKENFNKLFEEYTSYRKTNDDEVRGLIERGHENESKMDSAIGSLKETEGNMKWTMQHDRVQRERNRYL